VDAGASRKAGLKRLGGPMEGWIPRDCQSTSTASWVSCRILRIFYSHIMRLYMRYDHDFTHKTGVESNPDFRVLARP
jgi:hypothetical protein